MKELKALTNGNKPAKQFTNDGTTMINGNFTYLRLKTASTSKRIFSMKSEKVNGKNELHLLD